MDPAEEYNLEQVRKLLEIYTLEELLETTGYTPEIVVLHLILEGYIDPPEVTPL